MPITIPEQDEALARCPQCDFRMEPRSVVHDQRGHSLWTHHREAFGRAREFNPSLDPQVVFGQHGWWEACDELGPRGYPPHGPDSANLNLILRQTAGDPISGSSPCARPSATPLGSVLPAREGREVGRGTGQRWLASP